MNYYQIKVYFRKLGYKSLIWLHAKLNSFIRIIMPPQAYLLMTVTDGFIFSRCLSVVTELNIQDYISKNGTQITELANKLSCNEENIYRVMRMLCSKGVFKEKNGKIFYNTDLSNALKYNKKSSIFYWLKYFNSDEQYKQWGEILQTVKNGKDAYTNSFNKPIFEWYMENNEAKNLFNNAMKELSLLTNCAIVNSYNFKNHSSIIDIGGGIWSLLFDIIKKFDKIQGIIFDTEDVIKEAQKLTYPNQKETLLFIEGDFFDLIPSDKDIYLIKSILHDWCDNKAEKILNNCYKAMNNDSKLLIIEMIVKNDNNYQFEKRSDIAMMILSGGKERTLLEYNRLLEKSNLIISDVINTPTPFYIIEATKNNYNQ